MERLWRVVIKKRWFSATYNYIKLLKMTFIKICASLTFFLGSMQIADFNNLSVQTGGAEIQYKTTNTDVDNLMNIDQTDSIKPIPVLCYHYVRNIPKGSKYVLP